MARPFKTGLDYFPHDTDASHDEKIEAMEAEFGLEGYAFVFKLLERIYRAGGILAITPQVTPQITQVVMPQETRPVSRELLATRVFGWSVDKFDRFLCGAIRLGIFDSTLAHQGVLTSNGIQKRFNEVSRRRKGHQPVIATLTPQETPAVTPAERGESKAVLKESSIKAEESKALPPTLPQKELTKFEKMAEERLCRPTGTEPWERDPRYVNAGRRPMLRYPELWLSTPEAAAVFECWDQAHIPHERWKKMLMAAEARAKTPKVDGRSNGNICVFNWLISFIMQDEVKALAEEARRDRYEVTQ